MWPYATSVRGLKRVAMQQEQLPSSCLLSVPYICVLILLYTNVVAVASAAFAAAGAAARRLYSLYAPTSVCGLKLLVHEALSY